MSEASSDLHGNAPDNSTVALLLIDVTNDLEFEGGEILAAQLLAAAAHISALRLRARRAGIPVIYVNDNFGKWRSDFRKLVHHVIEDETRGQKVAERLRPSPDDYFVLKPKQSGFFATSLDLLLQHLGLWLMLLWHGRPGLAQLRYSGSLRAPLPAALGPRCFFLSAAGEGRCAPCQTRPGPLALFWHNVPESKSVMKNCHDFLLSFASG